MSCEAEPSYIALGSPSQMRVDGELIRLMGIAFEMALGSFGATPAHDDPIRAALAHNIIALAKAGDRDPERLCEAALQAVSAPDPLPRSLPPVELPEV